MMDYCKGIQCFIIIHYLIQKNLVERVLDVNARRCKNKEFFDLDFVMMHLL